MKPVPIAGEELDLHRLNHELDKVKAAVFMGEYANFFGAIMCSQNFIWTKGVRTAAVDGINFYWNPDDFDHICTPTMRISTIMHELWHIARLDIPRLGNRDPRTWNYACDININNDLKDQGFEVPEPYFVTDPYYRGWVTEDIYDDLINKAFVLPDGDFGDMLDADEESKIRQVESVCQAAHSTALNAGKLPGSVEVILKQFLAPVVPWEAALWGFFTELQENDFSWQTRDRRYNDVYLPGEIEDDGRLGHLAYIKDTSGSCGDQLQIRFHSEIRFIKDNFKPKKMSFVQFDTIIQDVQVFKADDPFEEILVKGRGGTCLVCVREWLIQNRPTAAVIFTDLEVSPMEPLPFDIPIVWIVAGNPKATVPFGDIIHIKG